LKAVEGFVHVVVDLVCGRASNFVEIYPRVTSETSTNIHNLVEALKAFIGLHFSKDPAEIAKELAPSGLPGKLCQVVATSIHGRSEDLQLTLARRATTEIAHSYLKDFDWSMRMVLSSEKLSKVRQPLLLLTLIITDIDGSKKEQLIELTVQKLEELLATFGTVDAVLRKLVSS